jgi:SAM-dependent methyltransferase
MSVEDSYADIAPYYDLEFESFDADIDLYLGYAQVVGGPILELGCGTGRLLTPFASAGFDVVGLDNSAAMVDLARERISNHESSDRIDLVHADMQDLSAWYGRQFRLAFIAINSFLHLESQQEQIKALSEIRKVLDRDGLLVIDVFNPSPDALARMDDRFAFDAEWRLDSGDSVQRFSHRSLESVEQLITTQLFYDRVSRDGTVSRKSTSYRMRYVHRFELELLLVHAGFEIEGLYGSHALDPLQSDSDNLIAVAHRTPNPDEI